jgi:hypothetical protein
MEIFPFIYYRKLTTRRKAGMPENIGELNELQKFVLAVMLFKFNFRPNVTLINIKIIEMIIIPKCCCRFHGGSPMKALIK